MEHQEFRLIVAGGRDYSDYPRLKQEILKLANEQLAHRPVSIVSGMAKGADTLGVLFAREHNVPLYKFPANWDLYGKRAGFIRNEEMGQFADGLLAFWDGQSRGTKHMIDYMKRLGKPVHVRLY